MSALILLILIIGLLVWLVQLYNTLIGNRNEYQNAFSQIDVQLTRRYDLIPNLLETVKGYMAHEKTALEAVIQARSSAFNSLQTAKQNIGQSEAMNNLSQADNVLTQALGRIAVLSEAYPELKADQVVQEFSEELSSTENRVAFSRQAYNDAVMTYNNSVEMFPSNLIASWFRFSKAALLTIDSSEKRQVPIVKF